MFERLADGSPIIKMHPMASNELPDGTILYAKIHGMKYNIPANQSHTFEFVVPYSMVYFQGAEILMDIVGVNNFTINHPVTSAVIEQYGFNVNMGTIKYQREARYAAKIPQGFKLQCVVANDTDQMQEFGVNFILHEVRTE